MRVRCHALKMKTQSTEIIIIEIIYVYVQSNDHNRGRSDDIIC